MKKKYIIPQMTMLTFAGETFCEEFNAVSGLNCSGQNDFGGTAKENNFSSFDYDFDEEDESESNSSSKSLWD